MKTIYYIFILAIAFSCIGLAFVYGPTFIIITGACLLAVVINLYKEGRDNGTI